ncbi:ABC transporter permease subunit [Enterococcus casseliflavus]|uniref:ABC transporter permease subunit n=1 Tax=Enterococcus casseliflavus TaxID=37734 RepID=UPI001432C5B7|nr:ABC transporter permease subunit [Enterococcus casseliflavus]MDB1694614.1 ABC transporter permease subunit [Enterococcus casseliflavus]MDB1698048.1 ABC transporter permease subunit [Enterococcus casseliflavus]MDB1703115.1 ABC transporter permease subunit [Enterococcus casseliflavus]MDB1704089.1 ABC transporter permease subunit [Enterococcus casseliflavus]NKD39517.1 ABC transporter permease subunit [Enterococcus casseliflavus]
MKVFLVFLKKEFLGGLRSKKLLICLILFALIGMLSPFTAKIMPDLMASMMPESIEITIADPTSIDAWLQFYSNIGTIGLLVFVVLFTDTLSAEIAQGTFIQLITKGLPKTTIVCAKAGYLTILWSLSYLLSASVSAFYTLIYFDDSSAVQVPSALFSYWLFGLLAISILLLGSSFAKSIYQGLLFIGVCYLMGMLGNLWSQVTNWNPYSLSSQFPNYLTDQIKLGELLPALLLTCFLIIACLTGSIAVLRKRNY